jgi:hypothetical protein
MNILWYIRIFLGLVPKESSCSTYPVSSNQMSRPNNDCGVYLSTTLSIKSLVHKMQSRMMICAAQPANHVCLICILYARTFSVFVCCLEWKIVL